MQAEEKNPKNTLASGLTQFWDRIKGRQLYIYGGITLFLIAGLVLFYTLRRNAREAEALRWRELDSANTEEKLKEIIKSDKHQGKITQTLAKLDLARIYLYERGINQLGSSKSAESASTTDSSKKLSDFDKAMTDIETGRDYYVQAVTGLKDNPMLEQEAYVSLAKAEQILSAVPKPDNASEFQGSIAKAIEYYNKAAAIHPDSEPSKNYAKEAADMAADTKKATEFYQELYKYSRLFSAPALRDPGPTPPPPLKDPSSSPSSDPNRS